MFLFLFIKLLKLSDNAREYFKPKTFCKISCVNSKHTVPNSYADKSALLKKTDYRTESSNERADDSADIILLSDEEKDTGIELKKIKKIYFPIQKITNKLDSIFESICSSKFSEITFQDILTDSALETSNNKENGESNQKSNSQIKALNFENKHSNSRIENQPDFKSCKTLVEQFSKNKKIKTSISSNNNRKKDFNARIIKRRKINKGLKEAKLVRCITSNLNNIEEIEINKYFKLKSKTSKIIKFI